MFEFLPEFVVSRKWVEIMAPSGRISGSVELPLSKSICNRLLVLNHLSEDRIRYSGLSGASDTLVMKACLDKIRGCNGRGSLTLDTGNAGTVMRFLMPMLCHTPGKWILTGDHRMQERPVGALVKALRSLGAEIQYIRRQGYPPVVIRGSRLDGGKVAIDASMSSQFLSALLLVAPFLKGGLEIQPGRDAVSATYVEMTLKLMEKAGIRIAKKDHTLRVFPWVQHPAIHEINVERDWSSAAFFYGASVLSGHAAFLLKGLSMHTVQGDSRVAGYFAPLGVETDEIADGMRIRTTLAKRSDVDLSLRDVPDLAPVLISVMAALPLHGFIRDIAHIRYKESDRLEILFQQLKNNGFDLLRIPGGLHVTDKFHPRDAYVFDPAGDHRLAMSFALLALPLKKIYLAGPDCVMKSFPGFWEQMIHLGFSIHETDPHFY
ncbi:MAG: hypothetical protein R6T99_06410 [Bacteroidales bacterium]